MSAKHQLSTAFYYMAERFTSNYRNYIHSDRLKPSYVIRYSLYKWWRLNQGFAGLLRRLALNKNVCHFSVSCVCLWNLQDVFCVGFSFQASGFISSYGISSSSTVCYCKAAVVLSAACVRFSVSVVMFAFLCVLELIRFCRSVSVRVCLVDVCILCLSVEFNGVLCCFSCCLSSAVRG